MPAHSVTAGDDALGMRLDRYVAERLGLLSRSQITARDLTALVNGRPAKRSRVLRPGDRLDLAWNDAPPADLLPENIPLDVLYEDDRVIVVNKPQGMVVHPGAGNPRGTLVNALLFRGEARGLCPRHPRWEARGLPDPPFMGFDVKPMNGGSGRPMEKTSRQGVWGAAPPTFRPGIVHRLDKDTSGVLIAAWDAGAHEFLAAQFKARRVRKTYAALVRGVPREAGGRIEGGIIRGPRDRRRFTLAADGRGKPSLTLYRVVKTWGTHSLILLRPRTGRTHQIRVHLRAIGRPILGDPVYGEPDRRFPGATLMLHARRLRIQLPGEDFRMGDFRAPFPARFLDILGRLGLGQGR